MKIRVEVEVEPTELREFLGLPDLSGLQEDALDAISRRLRSGGEGIDPDGDPARFRAVRTAFGRGVAAPAASRAGER